MKDLNKSVSSVGQNTAHKKTTNKHDVNLQKNSILYFQVGLILTLLAVYGLFDMKFDYDPNTAIYVETQEDDDAEFVGPVEEVKKSQLKQVKELPKVQKKLIDIIDVVPDDISKDNLEETLITIDETHTDKPFDDTTVADPVDPEGDDLLPVPVTIVQQVPVFPGCEKYEGNNKELFKCMSNKIGKIVERKFDTNLANDYGLKGQQNIYVQFKIDQTGQVSEIVARAPHAALKDEAIRVTHKIPKMIKPGFQDDKPVPVLYSLPIKFKVQD